MSNDNRDRSGSADARRADALRRRARRERDLHRRIARQRTEAIASEMLASGRSSSSTVQAASMETMLQILDLCIKVLIEEVSKPNCKPAWLSVAVKLLRDQSVYCEKGDGREKLLEHLQGLRAHNGRVTPD